MHHASAKSQVVHPSCCTAHVPPSAGEVHACLQRQFSLFACVTTGAAVGHVSSFQLHHVYMDVKVGHHGATASNDVHSV